MGVGGRLGAVSSAAKPQCGHVMWPLPNNGFTAHERLLVLMLENGVCGAIEVVLPCCCSAPCSKNVAREHSRAATYQSSSRLGQNPRASWAQRAVCAGSPKRSDNGRGTPHGHCQFLCPRAKFLLSYDAMPSSTVAWHAYRMQFLYVHARARGVSAKMYLRLDASNVFFSICKPSAPTYT